VAPESTSEVEEVQVCHRRDPGERQIIGEMGFDIIPHAIGLRPLK
jgi:hypothetical protein